MEVLTEQFKSFSNSESKEFAPILEIMSHDNKEEGRRFLNLVNNVINYYSSLQNPNNEISYQIIHIPACEPWARELLLHFLIFKTAICLNRTTLDRLEDTIQGDIILKEGEGTKVCLQIIKKRKYIRQLLKIGRELDIPTDEKKTLIVTLKGDMIMKKKTDSLWFDNFFSESIFASNHNLTVSSTTTAHDLECLIREDDDIPTIENLFIFHSPNKSRVTNSYSKNQLERLNRYGLGIKNCFIFSLSEKPFQLYHTIDNIKNGLSSAILQKTITKYDDFDGFITFTQTETNYLFARKSNQKTTFIDCPERTIFTQEIDQFIDDVPNNLKLKTELSLSFSDELQDIYFHDIASEIQDFSKDLCSNFFSLLRQTWDNEICNQIEKFICNSSSVAFVLPNDIPKAVKYSLSHLFLRNNRKINYISFYDLKKGVNVERLVVLQYRSANGYFKPYPNSFDPIPLKNNQSALIIFNKLTHNNYYEWDNYWYSKSYNGLLFSKFRKDVLDWKMQQFQRPTSPSVKNFIDVAENEARIYETEKCKIYYKGRRQPKEYLACERVIYEENNLQHIAELRSIANLKDISIQMIDDIVEQVKVLILKKSEENTNAEKIVRSNPKFNLSETEINSSTELWQFLLKREVINNDEKTVYNDLFSQTPEDERISLNTFTQWYNIDKSIILPRKRKHQNLLLTYLGFDIGSAYHRIIIKKKSSNINDTRLLNSQIEALLRKTLFKTIKENDFYSIIESHSDIFTILDIKSIGDLNALISLLEISLTPIDHIEYEQDEEYDQD
jgi:hypothetical protein